MERNSNLKFILEYYMSLSSKSQRRIQNPVKSGPKMELQKPVS